MTFFFNVSDFKLNQINLDLLFKEAENFFSVGDFDGSEKILKSILENAPPLAMAIAKGLGVSIGKLKELGEAGKLSSVAVFKAILKQQSEIEEIVKHAKK